MAESNFPFKEQKYDYVFCGMGCASLSLLMRMIRSGKFNDKKIVLIDKEPKTKNDRTWCFWEKENGFFDEIVYKKWPVISFLSDDFSSDITIAPYIYKMIRGIDFYKYCFNEIAKHPNIELVYGNLESWEIGKEGTMFHLNGRKTDIGKPIVFNSIYTPAPPTKKTTRLLQHFKGWKIEAKQPAFDPAVATMMDFRVDQGHGTTFAYVLPFSPTSALIEYTLFTKELLPKEEYDKALRHYIKTFLGIADYSVTEEEFGVIPMTNEKLQFKGHGWQIGTAGGQTKGSSGYTFQFIQKQSALITKQLLKNQPLEKVRTTPRRFRFYDNTLLDILYHDKLPGKKIFTLLFKKNKPQRVLRFLDNETTLNEELKIFPLSPPGHL